jgi:hypothetical protein
VYPLLGSLLHDPAGCCVKRAFAVGCQFTGKSIEQGDSVCYSQTYLEIDPRARDVLVLVKVC